jgi:hypothetical protein
MSAKYYGTKKVGETFEYDGKKYRVMNGARDVNVCLMCDLHEIKGCHEMCCLPFMREGDKGNIYYKEVK